MKESLLILTGHSKGLGTAILSRFLRERSMQVIAISRTSLTWNSPALREIQVDLSDLKSLEANLPKIFPAGEFDKVFLVNNAGWIGEIKAVGKLQPGEITKAMNLNLLAPMILTDAFVKAYADLKGDKLICNISSGAAHKPMPGWGEYCSSKAGLSMFSKVAAEDVATQGIRVFSVAPGIVDTAMQVEIRKADQSDFPALERFRDFKNEGKLMSAENVAEKIFYLLNNPGLFSEVIQDVRDFDLP